MAIKVTNGTQSPDKGWNINRDEAAKISAKQIQVKPALSHLAKFLRLAWRTQGKTGFIATRNPDTGVFQHHPVAIGDDMDSRVAELAEPDLDVHFTVAEFASPDSRKSNNVHAINGFHVDLDCGAEKAADGIGYKDLDAAQVALSAFCETAKLPPPNVTIKSGGGLHGYWFATTGLDPSTWKEYAVKLKATAKALKFLADPARTSDAASLMRAPGTRNHKYHPARPVEILELSDRLIPTDELRKAINAAFKRHVKVAVSDNVMANTADSVGELPRRVHSPNELAAMVGELDPDMVYPEWIAVVMAVYRETDGSEAGFHVVNNWSSKGSKYKGESEIRAKWDSVPGYTDKPITVGTIKKMLAVHGVDWKTLCHDAGDEFDEIETVVVHAPDSPCEVALAGAGEQVGADTDESVHPLAVYSLTGSSGELRAEALSQVFVLQDIGLSGQFLVIYAKHNTGKTLIVLVLLTASIRAGRIQPENLYFLNLDDTHDGLTIKTELAELNGFHMLCDGYRGFDVRSFRAIIQELVETDRCAGIIIVLDTLKKFTDTMDKRKASAFMRLMRQFISKGGTVIALAHVNKNPGADGKPVYSGTTDIVDDADCAYVVDTAGTDDVAQTRTVEFSNIKRRGNVRNQVAFRYSTADNLTYAELLDSVEAVDYADLVDTKQAETTKHDADVIEAVTDSIRAGITSKMALKVAAAEKSGVSQNHALQVIDRYTGTDPATHRWNYCVGARGAKTFTLLEVSNDD